MKTLKSYEPGYWALTECEYLWGSTKDTELIVMYNYIATHCNDLCFLTMPVMLLQSISETNF